MDVPDRIRHIHDQAARVMGSLELWELHCRKCSVTRPGPSQEEMAAYFEVGWPRHCFETMEIRRRQ